MESFATIEALEPPISTKTPPADSDPVAGIGEIVISVAQGFTGWPVQPLSPEGQIIFGGPLTKTHERD